MTTAPTQGAGALLVSVSVDAVFAAAAGQDVTPLNLVHAIAQRHSEYAGGRITALLPAPPPDAVRQSVEAWRGELGALLAQDHRLDGRTAIVLLCLLDAPLAPAAEATGLLWQVAAECSPPLRAGLSDAGLRLLARRSRLLAASLGMSDPVLLLQPPQPPPSGGRPLLALAPQTIAGSSGVAEWAHSDGSDLYRGRGKESTRLLDGTNVTGLRWGLRGVLLVAHRDGLTACRPGAEPISRRLWGQLAEIAVSDGLVVAARLGEFLTGMPDSDHPDQHSLPLLGAVEHVATSPGDNWVAAVGDSLVLYSPRSAAWDVFPTGKGAVSALAAGPDGDVVAGLASGSLLFLRAMDEARTATEAPPVGSGPVALLDAGPAGLAVSTDGPEGSQLLVWRSARLIGRIEHALPIRAVSVSPDGAAVGTIDDAGMLRIWRIDTPDVLRLTSYTPDTTTGDDLLGISETVDGLAALVSACVVQPPLSVGLFGAWGAGKTFLLHKLEQRVTEIAADARASGRRQRDLWAWRNIAQVQFNAWNYASADVWAGLTDKLLRALARANIPEDALPARLEAERKDRMQRLVRARREAEKRRGAAEHARRAATEALGKAEQRLAQAENSIAEARGGERKKAVDAAREEFNKAVDEAGLTDASKQALDAATSVTDVIRVASETRQVLQSAAVLLHARQGRRWLVVTIVGTPLAALLVGLLVNLAAPHLTAVVGALAGITAGCGAVTNWLRTATTWQRQQLARVDVLEQELRKRRDEASQEVACRRADVERAQQQLKIAQEHLAQAQQEVGANDRDPAVAAVLAEYITSRASSDDYRGQLGLIGTVREDLDTISGAVALNNDWILDPARGTPNDDAVNRIVLYIDDLDRCPPTTVVRVLEAISLLLSYPLFVVVVAVDARWVSRALGAVYPDMLAGGEVTPEDYLEKIFQLPVWLDPLEANAARGMVDALLGPDRGVGHAPELPAAPRGHAQPAPGAAVPPPGPVHRSDGTADFIATSPPVTLQLAPDERTMILQLAPLLTRSPRALKRYLNTYRLLKSSVQGPGQLEVVRILLAISSGRPRAGEALLRILESEELAAAATLSDAVAALPEADTAWLRDALDPSVLDLRSWSAEQAREVVPSVRRYVFRTASEGVVGRPRGMAR